MVTIYVIFYSKDYNLTLEKLVIDKNHFEKKVVEYNSGCVPILQFILVLKQPDLYSKSK